MNGSLLILICSLFYSFLTIIVYFSKKRINSIENKIFSCILIVNLVGLILDILSNTFAFYINNNLIFSIVNKAYILYLLTWISLFTYYSLVISFNKEKIRKLLKYFALIYFILCFVVILLPLYSKVDLNKFYTYGPCANLLYGVSGIFVAIIVISLLLNIKKIRSKKYIPMLTYITVGMVATAIQMYNPTILIITAMETFVTVLLYHTIENPDVKMIEQLEIARDSADKANSAKTDFLSSMSHEIRTPLNAIVGFSDCIKNSNDLAEAKENADDIINASNTLIEIVNGILDISKIEAGKLEIINSSYNANNLFSGLGKLMTPKMVEKGLDFQVTIAPDLPTVLYGDSSNIKKVVTNLLSNAYKYTDSGFVKYDVKCVNANGVCRLIISVTDSGRGIKKESISKLFTKFQRVDEDRNTTIEGTGLGLAITKQLVELMGGNVVVDSVYGEGSKFTITLDQRIDNVQLIEEKISSDNIDLTGKRILVVDDNSINLKVAKKLLERYNATVEVCDSGFKCIELINSGSLYDLILMDDMMPKMSGTQTLQKLKENSSFSIPVFALTANAITGMREKYLAIGFDNYLAKPIEKDAMIDAFNKLFNSTKEAVLVKENPVEKETVVEIETLSEEKTPSLDVVKNIDYLKSNNIDVERALELLGDMDLYNDTMNDFIDEVNNRLPLLDEYKKNSDMPNYAILVHAIKSDCKYLGIMTLADIALEHELKSKANDVDFVNSNYDNLIINVNHYLDICKKYMGRD